MYCSYCLDEACNPAPTRHPYHARYGLIADECDEVLKRYPELVDDLIPDCDDARDERLLLEFLNSSDVNKVIVDERCRDPLSSPCHPGLFHRCYHRSDICSYQENDIGLVAPCRNANHLRFCKDHQCPRMYKCKDTFCIPYELVCDGIRHCPLDDDEHNCTYSIQRSCPGLFKCKDSQTCIDMTQLCDNQTNCPVRGEDEVICQIKLCPGGCTCIGEMYDCSNSSLVTLPAVSTSVKSFIVSHNKIVSFSMSQKPRLLKIDISHNKVNVLSTGSFSGNWNLLYLNIAFNRIARLFTKGFHGLSNLVELNLTGNPLSILDAHCFLGLLSLPSITISSRHLRTLPRCVFTDLVSLQVLVLQNTSISYLDEKFLCDLPTVTEFKSIDNQLSLIYGYPFQKIPNLLHVETDQAMLCCSLPLKVGCSFDTPCSTIIPSTYLKISIWTGVLIIFTGNILSIVFSLECNLRWLAFILVLNLSDLLQGMHLLIMATVDAYYRQVYTSWSIEYWHSARLCTLSRIIAQFSFQFSLYLNTINVVERVVVTKYAMKRINMPLSWKTMLIISGAFVHLVISCINGLLVVESSSRGNSVCLFTIYSSQTIYIQWATLVCNTLAISVIVVVNGITAHFFLTRKHPASSSAKNRQNERVLVYRIVTATILYSLVYIYISGILIINLLDVRISAAYIWVEVCALSLTAAMNPIIHTFTKSKFIMRMRNLC